MCSGRTPAENKAMVHLCLPRFYPSIILTLCLLLHAACSDFSALSSVPLSEVAAVLCLQLSLDLSILWESSVSVAVLLLQTEAQV